MWILQLPLRVRVTKKKERYFSLNLNQYRNTNPFTLNTAKENFDELVQPLIRAQKIPKLKRCTLEYVLYPGNSQLCDVNNICTIVDKFFSDSLVGAGVLPDDNYNFLADSRFRFGAIDRENPRVEVIIRNPDLSPGSSEPITQKEVMKIQTITTALLTPDDFKTAITEFLVKHAGVSPDAQLVFGAVPTEDLEIRITQAALLTPQVPAAAPTRTRRTKTEPKDAIKAVNEALAEQKKAGGPPKLLDANDESDDTSEEDGGSDEPDEATDENEEPAAQTTEAPAPVAPKSMGICPDCAVMLTVENTSTLPGGKVVHVGCLAKTKPAETIPAPAAPPAVKVDPIDAMRTAKTLPELDAAFEASDKGKSAKAIYDTCKDAISEEAPPPPKKGGLFGNFPRPKND